MRARIEQIQRTLGNAAIQRVVAPAPDDGNDHAAGALHDALATPGRALSPDLRSLGERVLGEPMDTVRVHSDPTAARAADALGARALTVGEHVLLADQRTDRETMLHEQVHVVQQRRGPVSGTDHGDGLRLSDPRDHHEREAEAIARSALDDGGLRTATPSSDDRPGSSPGAGTGAAVQRWTTDVRASGYEEPSGRRHAYGDIVSAVRSHETDAAAAGEVPSDLEKHRLIAGLGRIRQLVETYAAKPGRDRSKVREVRAIADDARREIDRLLTPSTAGQSELVAGHSQLAPFAPYLLKEAMIVFRLDGRGPAETVENRDFRAFTVGPHPAINEGGAVSQMTSTSKDPTIPARYQGYARMGYERAPGFRYSPTIYALVVLPGQAVDTHRWLTDQKAEADRAGRTMPGQDNIGTQEVSAIRVQKNNIIGYRRLDGRTFGDYVETGSDFTDEVLRRIDGYERLTEFVRSDDLVHEGRM